MGNGRSVCPEYPGLHASYNVGTIGIYPERGWKSPNANLSSDRGLQLALVKLESVVIAHQQCAVNTSLLLAHTARQTTRVGSE